MQSLVSTLYLHPLCHHVTHFLIISPTVSPCPPILATSLYWAWKCHGPCSYFVSKFGQYNSPEEGSGEIFLLGSQLKALASLNSTMLIFVISDFDQQSVSLYCLATLFSLLRLLHVCKRNMRRLLAIFHHIGQC